LIDFYLFILHLVERRVCVSLITKINKSVKVDFGTVSWLVYRLSWQSVEVESEAMSW